MRFKITLILFGVFLVLGAFVLFFESKRKPEKGKEEKLVDLASADVVKITFKKESETLSFQKDEKGQWLITQPMEAKADNSEVSSLADDFSSLKIERVVEEEPKDLSRYEIPRQEVSLWFKGKEQPLKILIGMENPLDNTFFAKREDEKRVVLIPSTLKSMFEKKLFDFRQKDIFGFDTEAVKRIKLRAKEAEWEALKKEEEWFFEKPVKALATKSKIENVLNTLSNLKAKEFISEAKNDEEIEKYGLEKPEYEISLSLPLSNQEVIFTLQKKEDKVYATTSLSSKIVTAEENVLSELEKKAAELREKQVAVFYSWQADKLYLKKGELSLTVLKDKDDKWHFETATKEEADSSKVETFIRKIESMEGAEFIDPPLNLADYGLDKPQAEVKIRVKEDEKNIKEVHVFIGAEDKEKKQVAVKNARLDYLFRVDSSILTEFPKEAKDWKKEKQEEKEKKS